MRAKYPEPKNCPFCGGKVNVSHGMLNVPFWFFKCQNAKCRAVVSFDNMDANYHPERAMKNWNGRVKDDG